ncbi:MAG TPA: hypothetical protein VFY23_15485 [Candidatus Limnocylindrales bacterium]|nr:hypothetical protein [Candidatus Limnocylindrales bacterium]
MEMIGWMAFVAAGVLIVKHKEAAKAYLGALEARYGHRDPGPGWLIHPDPDPDVERLRRRRLYMVVPASVLLMTGIVLVVYG